jgi:pimeloyl-ACP methyl ester carboxylesterase
VRPISFRFRSCARCWAAGTVRTTTGPAQRIQDFCTPPQLSDELARGIPDAKRVRLTGGHLIHDEDEEQFFEAVRGFIDRN